jgi:hypothetical protein
MANLLKRGLRAYSQPVSLAAIVLADIKISTLV